MHTSMDQISLSFYSLIKRPGCISVGDKMHYPNIICDIVNSNLNYPVSTCGKARLYLEFIVVVETNPMSKNINLI